MHSSNQIRIQRSDKAYHVTSATLASRILGSSIDEADFPDSRDRAVLENLRSPVERRNLHPLLADWRCCLRGRRKCIRRSSDYYKGHAVLDWYSPTLLFFIVTTYVLSGIDAILTLTLLEMGVAKEANPFMHLLLAQNIHLFSGVKALTTGIGLVCLTAYSNQCLFAKLRVDRLIYALFVTYSALVVYEIWLLKLAESAGWPT